MSIDLDPKWLDAYVARLSTEDGDCLRWTGFAYGAHPGGVLGNRKFLVVRALWEAKRGPIPEGRILRCTCDLKMCVNLDHRKLMTRGQLAKVNGALGLMSGPIRSAKIAAAKRAGPQAKVSDEDVKAIRESDEPGHVLAQRYGVTGSAISKYRLYKTRKEYGTNPFLGLMTGA
jgi:hypothetical protein